MTAKASVHLTAWSMASAGAFWAFLWSPLVPYQHVWSLIMGVVGWFLGRWVAREQLSHRF